MVRHQAVGQPAQGNLPQGFGQDFFERRVGAIILEDTAPAVSAVGAVENHPAGSVTQRLGHAEKLPALGLDANNES